MKPEGIHDSDDAIEARDTIADSCGTHRRDRADGLSNRFRFADAACLNHDIIETVAFHKVEKLVHEVHLEGAANAAVLEGNEIVVALSFETVACNEACIDVYFADIIDDYGKADSFSVVEYFIEKRGLAASEIACDQQDRRNFGISHIIKI